MYSDAIRATRRRRRLVSRIAIRIQIYRPDPVTWLGNAAGNRALSIGDNAPGEADAFGVLGFLPGLPSVIIVVILLGIAAKTVLSTDRNKA